MHQAPREHLSWRRWRSFAFEREKLREIRWAILQICSKLKTAELTTGLVVWPTLGFSASYEDSAAPERQCSQWEQIFGPNADCDERCPDYALVGDVLRTRHIKIVKNFSYDFVPPRSRVRVSFMTLLFSSCDNGDLCTCQ